MKLEIVEEEFLPIVFRGGATYSLFEKLLLHAELEKDFDFPFVFKNGIEYELVKDLWMRVGSQNKPTTFSFGMGYQFKRGLCIELAGYYQQGIDVAPPSILGSSFIPSFGIGYDFKRRNLE